MRTIYLDCSMGAAGDMLTAALYELTEDREGFLEVMNGAGLGDISFIPERVSKCGICGTHMKVLVNGQTEESVHDHSGNDEHHHSSASLGDVERMINALNLPGKVKEDAIAVYRFLAEAESVVHGKTVTEIHFHEVGTMDAIADITAVCYLFYILQAEQIIASTVHTGSGHVRCAHGELPVPAPATAYLLKGIPMTAGNIQGELCTPTGAALLKYFATSYENMPSITTERIGYGMGCKDFPKANCVRAFLGESEASGELITELSCNIDDMPAEQLGYAMGLLLDAGALDVYTSAVGMKKSRPGVMLVVLCDDTHKAELLRMIFKHTSTLGVRENVMKRYVLERTETEVSTPYGNIRKKVSQGYGVTREKWEYEDLARIAGENDLSIEELKARIGV